MCCSKATAFIRPSRWNKQGTNPGTANEPLRISRNCRRGNGVWAWDWYDCTTGELVVHLSMPVTPGKGSVGPDENRYPSDAPESRPGLSGDDLSARPRSQERGHFGNGTAWRTPAHP